MRIRKHQISPKGMVDIIVFIFILFWLFNIGHILYEIHTYNGRTIATVQDIKIIDSKGSVHHKGYEITLAYEYEGKSYHDVKTTYYPGWGDLKKCTRKAGDQTEVSINKNQPDQVKYEIWKDNERTSSFITSILCIVVVGLGWYFLRGQVS